MFTYRSSKNSNLKFTNAPISTIPMTFWNEIHMKATSEWPEVVRKYKLTPSEIEEAAARIKREKESKESWAEMSVRKYKR
jgi:hypothetical protein